MISKLAKLAFLFFLNLILLSNFLPQSVLAQDSAVNMKFKYEGAKLLFTTKPVFSQYTDVSSSFYRVKDTKEKIVASGEFTRKLYEVPTNSSYEAVYNYETQLVGMGFTVVSRYMNGVADWYVRRYICKEGLCGTLKKVGKDIMKELVNEQTIVARKSTPEGDYTVVVAGAEIKANLGFVPPEHSFDAQGNKPSSVTLTSDRVFLLVDIISPKQIEKKIVAEEISYIKGKLDSDGSVNIYGIYFDSDKAEVKPESAQALKNIADVLKSDANLKLNILGHTDNQGGAEYNLKLSERRAKAVMGYLVAIHGVDDIRLVAVGKGMADPLEGNDTEEGRAKNRRVELKKF